MNDSEKLKSVSERLDKLEAEVRPKPQVDIQMKARGFTMAMEFFLGPIVGLFVGMGLDRWMETSPLFLLIFLFLGFTAGVYKIIKAAHKETENQTTVEIIDSSANVPKKSEGTDNKTGI